MDPIENRTSGTAGETYGHEADENRIVAMFNTYEEARAARERLIGLGLTSSEIDILDRNAQPSDASFTYEHTDQGIWGAIKNLFVPEEDVNQYAEGVGRGHSILVVRPKASQREQVIEALEAMNPVDLESKSEEWRTSGWTGAHSGQAAYGVQTSQTSGSGVLGTTGSGVLGKTTGTGTLPATGATSAYTGDVGRDTTRDATRDKAGEQVVPIVEEQLRVGKRQVGGGHVRVRSYVVERPVEEQVRLRQESVHVERRPVGQTTTGTVPEEAFRERTIEVTATSEEAVIGKEARVVEEVVVRKDASERTETVRDTVRRTEVEVDDKANVAGAKTGVAGAASGVAETKPTPVSPNGPANKLKDPMTTKLDDPAHKLKDGTNKPDDPANQI